MPHPNLTPDPSTAPAHIGEPPVTLDHRTGPHGEVTLRRHGPHLQIIANGCFLMDTSDGRSERRLVDAALEALTESRKTAPAGGREAPATYEPRAGGQEAPAVLIGGLGVGFSLTHATADPRWGPITVVEREPAVIDWHRAGPLAPLTADALADPRTRVLEADLVTYVNETSDTYDALCLDIDNGPAWTVTEGNETLYSPSGLAACARVLRPGGVLAVWSAQPSPEFEGTLRNAGFQRVRTEEIPVARGVPDVVHLAVRPG
ncbi:spermidine synthase [Streptomyces sp. B3I8]|uniref:spermidine synthase n=1 Tax=Streptomyces sp. B3I8 TaxID=3042303 RepID=UPI002786ED20|nr:spermidine synthase [Streptomyces sp. B3I8]MDQ0789142.1 SAM-dependent methyltransferase [Streptomyces sp. B3I8]